MAIEEGKAPPAFTLKDTNGNKVALKNLKGQHVIIYFYPKDDTPGCTREACRFRDDYAELQQLGVKVIGISLDGPESHRAFAKKYALPFTLLSDPAGEFIRACGSLFKLGPLRLARRHTLLVDPQGRVAKIYRKVKPASHSQQVAADLRRLQSSAP